MASIALTGVRRLLTTRMRTMLGRSGDQNLPGPITLPRQRRSGQFQDALLRSISRAYRRLADRRFPARRGSPVIALEGAKGLSGRFRRGCAGLGRNVSTVVIRSRKASPNVHTPHILAEGPEQMAYSKTRYCNSGAKRHRSFCVSSAADWSHLWN
jgi:hypothetical protein